MKNRDKIKPTQTLLNDISIAEMFLGIDSKDRNVSLKTYRDAENYYKRLKTLCQKRSRKYIERIENSCRKKPHVTIPPKKQKPRAKSVAGTFTEKVDINPENKEKAMKATKSTKISLEELVIITTIIALMEFFGKTKKIKSKKQK